MAPAKELKLLKEAAALTSTAHLYYTGKLSNKAEGNNTLFLLVSKPVLLLALILAIRYSCPLVFLAGLMPLIARENQNFFLTLATDCFSSFVLSS